MKVTQVKLFQQANGYWRWRAMAGRTRVANAGQPYSNLPDARASMVAVLDPIRRKIPVTVTKKDGSRAAFK